MSYSECSKNGVPSRKTLPTSTEKIIYIISFIFRREKAKTYLDFNNVSLSASGTIVEIIQSEHCSSRHNRLLVMASLYAEFGIRAVSLT